MPPPQGTSPGFLSRFTKALAGKLGSQERPKEAGERIARLGMSRRQQQLNYLWACYQGEQYANRKLDWNGRECLDKLSHEVVATQGYIPPGFYDASRQTADAFPLKFRRPTAPYGLPTLIVNRFTGLLFSEKSHPEIRVDGDANTQDWLRAVAESSRLWAVMMQARAYGGAMGSVAIGFQFVQGRPLVEALNPTWLLPTFKPGSLELTQLENRYRYVLEQQSSETGQWEEVEYWYRRVITEDEDTLYQPTPVGRGEEPEWQVATQVKHGLGFCPVVWVQNQPVGGEGNWDGAPDMPGPALDNVEAIDSLTAQALRAILANMDPQLVLTTTAELTELRLGLDNALRVPDGDAKFLEINAGAITAGMKLAEDLRARTLEMSECVLDNPDRNAPTATEVRKAYAAMHAKAERMREQYGVQGVTRLLEMMWRAAKKLGRPRPAPVEDPIEGQLATPGLVRSAVLLPPRYEQGPEGEPFAVTREPGDGGTISLVWPGWEEPTLQDTNSAVTAAAGARGGNLIDDETAITFLAPYFKVQDKAGLVKRVREDAAKREAEMLAMMASSTTGPTEEMAPDAGVPTEGGQR